MTKMFEWQYVGKFLPKLLSFIPITLGIWIGTVLLGLVIGILFAIIRLREVKVLSPIVRVIISIVRGIPPLTQLFVIYYGLPFTLLAFGIDITSWDGIYFVIIAYGFAAGANTAENFRAAFLSVGKGQEEAAYSIGMTSRLAYTRILIPQALVAALPNFTTLCVSSLKNTSLAFSVGVIELMSMAQGFGSATNHRMESFVALAVIYYVLYLIINGGFRAIEKRVAYQKD